MYPSLKKDDLIIVKKSEIDELKIDDIITFEIENNIITHRIVKININDGKISYVTKGDNNEKEDKIEVNYERILGKTIFKISKIGILVEYIQKDKGIIKAITIIVIIFILNNLRENKKNCRKVKRKKYETKKLREKYKI